MWFLLERNTEHLLIVFNQTKQVTVIYFQLWLVCLLKTYIWTILAEICHVPHKNESPLSACFDMLVAHSYLVRPNKTLTPVMGLPLGMKCWFSRFTQSHPTAALSSTRACFLEMLQYVLTSY